MIFLLLPAALFLGYLQGMHGRDLQTFICLMVIVYYATRIFANLLFDADETAAHRENERRHMRSGFQGISYQNGKYVIRHNGDYRDHSQRCQDSLRDWYYIKQSLRWNNWRYLAMIISTYVIMEKMI